MAFLQDVASIREVLHANRLDEVIDDAILTALLVRYESDDQRVDLVVLDLQDMLGKDLSAGQHFDRQKQRWEELQRPIEIRNPLPLIDSGNVVQATIAPGVVDQSRPSTSRTIDADVSQLAPVRNKRQIIEVSTYSNRAKRVTPTKTDEDHASVTTTAVVKPAPRTSLTMNAKMPAKKGDESRHGRRQQNGVPVAIVLEDDFNSKQALEAKSIHFHMTTLSAIPEINSKFAAFKASEFVSLYKYAGRLEEYLAFLKAEMNLATPRADVPWIPPLDIDAEHQNLFQHVYESFINEKIEFLIRALPEVDPDFLEDKVNSVQGDQEKLRGFLTEILERNVVCPTRAEYNRRMERNALANKFFTVEEFLELYDDPIVYFKNDTRVTDAAYCEEAINQLKKDFKFGNLTNIRRVFREANNHYTPAYFNLLSNPMTNQRKTKRSPHEYSGTAKDLFLIQEIAFVALQPEIDFYLKSKEKIRKDAVVLSRANGTLLDCPICCEDELIDPDIVYCPVGHGVCGICVRRQSEELIGLMKTRVPCLFPECSTEYTLQVLKGVLKKSIFCCLEKRRQAEEVFAAGIEGLESCPFCDYCEVLQEEHRLFTCKNPECYKTSCRQCRELNHSPLRCEEHAMKQRLTHYVETKMTEALLRKCPTCKKNFVKDEGCNKMVCPCGTVVCYICRKQIKDYSHFYNLPPTKPNAPVPVLLQNGKCPLYSDTLKMHEEEVAKGAAKAQAELTSSNPNIRVDLVLAQKSSS